MATLALSLAIALVGLSRVNANPLAVLGLTLTCTFLLAASLGHEY